MVADLTDPEELHDLLLRPTTHGTHAVCRCGGWEGWWHSDRSEAWVRDDHDHHRRTASNGANVPPVQ